MLSIKTVRASTTRASSSSSSSTSKRTSTSNRTYANPPLPFRFRSLEDKGKGKGKGKGKSSKKIVKDTSPEKSYDDSEVESDNPEDNLPPPTFGQDLASQRPVITTEADKAANACQKRIGELNDDLKSLNFTVAEEQKMLNEIASLSGQLQGHLRQQKVEEQLRKQREAKEKEDQANKVLHLTQESNQAYVDQELSYWEQEENVRKALIQDVIDEAKEEGNPLPKSVVKLIDYFKGKPNYFIYSFYY